MFALGTVVCISFSSEVHIMSACSPSGPGQGVRFSCSLPFHIRMIAFGAVVRNVFFVCIVAVSSFFSSCEKREEIT